MKYQKHGNRGIMTDTMKDNGQTRDNSCVANIIMTKHLEGMNNEPRDFMSNVYDIIEKYQLKRKDRRQSIIYKRYYLYHQLQKAQLSLSHIGLLFNKDHATVIHGLKMHRMYMKSKDAIYLHHIQPIIDDLDHKPQPRILRDDILNCESMDELLIIKQNIQRNIY